MYVLKKKKKLKCLIEQLHYKVHLVAVLELFTWSSSAHVVYTIADVYIAISLSVLKTSHESCNYYNHACVKWTVDYFDNWYPFYQSNN